MIHYKQRMDIFNFVNGINFKVKVRIVGKPYSVSDKGYLGDHDTVTEIIRSFKGITFVLNADEGLKLPFAWTLSSHVFHNRFETFDDYLMELRSHYRYRIKKALNKRCQMAIHKIDGQAFTKAHYNLYLEVFHHSKDQLECLSFEYFQEMPCDLYEFRCSKSHKILGFIQVKLKADQLVFMFGGFDGHVNRHYDLYMNMLLFIIELGIEEKVKTIEFGQTAEETKLKLGCQSVKKYLYVHHSNPWIQKIIEKLLPKLSYKPHSVTYHVFKEET